jgi:hypothetical protein
MLYTNTRLAQRLAVPAVSDQAAVKKHIAAAVALSSRVAPRKTIIRPLRGVHCHYHCHCDAHLALAVNSDLQVGPLHCIVRLYSAVQCAYLCREHIG